ncbi:MAG: PQQ-dependent sugar dehydrogenase, partial [Methanomicrobiales archaeon]|nr:PQQ-dependent sugar dehydrogenase [Methanomicrobiales archaeon]
LLSMAFHPDYRNNGRVFLYYSRPLRAGAPFGWDCTNVISEYRVMPGNPDMTDMGSEKILLEIHKPSSNHNGGPLLFGPTDGFLYLPVGDGGGAGDTGFGHTPGIGNAQDLTTMLGKVICIDIDHATNGKLYGIPPSNPFVNKPGILPEIYAYGLRNPAYASFDSGGDHHLYVWNAGQQLFESAYRVLKGGNYGWHIREGTHCFDPGNPGRPPLGTTCPIVGYRNEPLIGPIVELGHDLGTTIVGGTIYRGAGLAGKQGAMIHGTWSRAGGSSGNGAVLISTGNISSISVDASLVTPEQNAMWETAEMRIVNNPGGRIEAYVRGVFEGTDHEAYLVFNRNAGPGDQPPTGEVWKLVPADTPGLVNTVTRSPSP